MKLNTIIQLTLLINVPILCGTLTFIDDPKDWRQSPNANVGTPVQRSQFKNDRQLKKLKLIMKKYRKTFENEIKFSPLKNDDYWKTTLHDSKTNPRLDFSSEGSLNNTAPSPNLSNIFKPSSGHRFNSLQYSKGKDHKGNLKNFYDQWRDEFAQQNFNNKNKTSFRNENSKIEKSDFVSSFEPMIKEKRILSKPSLSKEESDSFILNIIPTTKPKNIFNKIDIPLKGTDFSFGKSKNFDFNNEENNDTRFANDRSTKINFSNNNNIYNSNNDKEDDVNSKILTNNINNRNSLSEEANHSDFFDAQFSLPKKFQNSKFWEDELYTMDMKSFKESPKDFKDNLNGSRSEKVVKDTHWSNDFIFGQRSKSPNFQKEVKSEKKPNPGNPIEMINKKSNKYFSKDPFHNSKGTNSSIWSKWPKSTSGLYTNWSKWSRCSKQCKQSRRKRCRIASLCGTSIIREKRQCSGWRCQHERFHIIKPEDIADAMQSREVNELRPPSKADVRVLLNYNSMFYSRWSEWTACSRTCLTSRYRTCRYSLFCSNTVIREEAYCYTENSPCEKWYIRHKLSSKYVQSGNSGSNTFGTNISTAHKTELFSGGQKISLDPQKNSVASSSLLVSNPSILNLQISGNKREVDSLGENTINTNNVINGPDQMNAFDLTFSKNDNNYNAKDKYSYTSGGLSDVLNTVSRQSYFDYKQTHTPNWTQPRISYIPKYNKHFHQLSFGRQNDLPTKCGLSKFVKTPWTLKIIGGKEAPRDKWPWQVAILNRFKEVFCGGTLVAAQWVLTAAHCLRKRLYVRLAEHDLAIREGPELEYKITESVSHPLYDPATVDNDVALIRLPEPITLGDKISPACIPDQGSSLPVGRQCTIIGWGKERNNHFFGTDVLNEAEVPVISEKACKKVYEEYYITRNMFCAGYLGGRIDSCAGDSGGPLLCHDNGMWFIYGITSFGEGCGRKGKFGIYSKVSNYKKWISDVIRAHSHRTNNNNNNNVSSKSNSKSYTDQGNNTRPNHYYGASYGTHRFRHSNHPHT